MHIKTVFAEFYRGTIATSAAFTRKRVQSATHATIKAKTIVESATVRGVSMVVISQNKKQTIPFENMSFAATMDGYIIAAPDIVVKPSEAEERVLAKYDSEETAKEVLEEICKAYANGARLVIMQNRTEGKKEVLEHDGCKGCKFINLDIREYPCAQCKQSYIDQYIAKK